mgnify:CR=1 FL=1
MLLRFSTGIYRKIPGSDEVDESDRMATVKMFCFSEDIMGGKEDLDEDGNGIITRSSYLIFHNGRIECVDQNIQVVEKMVQEARDTDRKNREFIFKSVIQN